MKQKLYAILLLFSFLGILAHDLIPHHHEEHKSDLVASHDNHDHGDCHSDEADDHAESICDFPDKAFTDNNHNCPHHYHNCTFQLIDIQRSLTNKLQEKVKIFPVYVLEGSLISIYPESEKTILLRTGNELLPRLFLKRAKSLRAPPIC